MPIADRYRRLGPSIITPQPNAFRLWGNYTQQLDPSMKAAVYGGLFESSSALPVASVVHAACASADCTSSRYTSLGICHKCEDITSKLEKTCSNDTEKSPRKALCTWSLPGGQSLESFVDPPISSREPEIGRTFMSINSSTSTLALEHIPGTFSNVTILANVSTVADCTITTITNCLELPHVYSAPDFKPLAAECALFPCARTYTARMETGLVVEEEVKRSVGKGDWGDWMVHDLRPGLVYPDDIVIDPEENCTDAPCVFVANSSLIRASGNFFWHFWNGTVSGNLFRLAASTNEPSSILYNDGFTNFTYLDTVFGAISDSMTSAIRLTGMVGDDSTLGWNTRGVPEVPTDGQALLARDTCIMIRWGWIALPAAVGLLSIVLLIITMISVARASSKGAWKSSSLPVLFHGLSADSRTQEGQLSTLGEMKKEAKTLKVRLMENTAGALQLKPATGT
jgi:hypothetical protein